MVTPQSVSTPERLVAPHLIVRDLLDTSAVDALLDYACAREADFTPSDVRPTGSKGGFVDLVRRKSLQLRDLAGFEPQLRALVYDQAGELMKQLRMSAVETLSSFETQLVAHGDGGFFTRHIDTATGDRRRADVRVLSGVYYFHRRPKGFSGGELRLFDLRDPERFIDIEPTHNTLVLFPSWVLHEVRPISCASHRFADARFSVNCWVYAHLPKTQGGSAQRMS